MRSTPRVRGEPKRFAEACDNRRARRPREDEPGFRLGCGSGHGATPDMQGWTRLGEAADAERKGYPGQAGYTRKLRRRWPTVVKPGTRKSAHAK